MSKIESGKVDLVEEEFNLSDLVDNLLTMTNSQIEGHHHELSVNISGVTHEAVIGDSLRIQKVFTNLMGNAVKFTPDGGKIRLSITERLSNQAKVGCFEFVFEDNGIGMSEEFMDQIFEPFARAKDEQVNKIQGTGLGMPKMNGYDATRAIRTMNRNYCRQIPIIAMTANAFAEDVHAAKTVGMNEHIAKPLELKTLAKTLNRWLPKRT